MTEISIKITYVKFHSNLPGANELTLSYIHTFLAFHQARVIIVSPHIRPSITPSLGIVIRIFSDSFQINAIFLAVSLE